MTQATGTTAGRAESAETQTARAVASASQSASAHTSEVSRAATATPREADTADAGQASASRSGAHAAEGAYRIISEGEATDYRNLYNKPSVNGVILNGNLSLEDLGIQEAGDYIERNELADYINDLRLYTCGITASDGTVFRNGEGSTVLTAVVMADGEDISDSMVIIWYLDGERLSTGKTTLVEADNTDARVYRYEAYDLLGVIRGSAEVTITNIIDASQFWTTTTAPTTPNYTFTIANLIGDSNTAIKVGDIIYYSYYRYTVTSVSDITVKCGNRQSIRGAAGATGATGATGAAGETGATGEDAVLLRIDSSHGNMFKNNSVSTQLRVTIFYGGQTITNKTALTAAFGITAHLEWKWQLAGEDTYSTISASDSRLANDGFIFTLTPQDVDVKATFICDLVI